MSVLDLIAAYPEQVAFLLMLGMASSLLHGLVIGLIDFITGWIFYHRSDVRCKGFLTGQIHGSCHESRCYYRSECVHYAPRPPVLSQLKQLFGLKKNKR